MPRTRRPRQGGARPTPKPKPKPKKNQSGKGRVHVTRVLAVRILRQLAKTGYRGFSNRALADALDDPSGPRLERRDRGAVTNLVYGTLRHRARLDALIDARATKPGKLKGPLREILRVAVLELRELDKPPHVAISQAVAASRALDRSGRLARVVQGLLSAIVRDGEALDAAHGDGPDALVRRWSIPAWLAERWTAALGREVAVARARALSRPCSLDLRVDLGRTTRDAARERLLADDPALTIETGDDPDDPEPQLLRTRGGGALVAHPLHQAGLISIQARGSQRAVRALDPRPGERVLDVCAGMGTKTLQIAEHMGRRGTIVATDTSEARLREHRTLRARGGLDNAIESGALSLLSLHADMRAERVAEIDDGPSAGGFDRVLLDAPCTGLGNLARHPELRWATAPVDIGECVQLQRSLLRRSWSRVRPGGRLVYAVCSLEPEEGPTLVEEFVRETRGARLLQSLALTPEQHACDGFFLAALGRDP